MRSLLHPPAVVRDIALLVARVVLGVVLVAHGWQKFTEWGMSGTAATFAKMGIPMPTLSAWFAGLTELVGGVLLILGLLTPLAAVLVAATMAGAFWFVHKGAGVFVAGGGWELVGVIAAAAIALAGAGAGRFSLDGLLARRAHRDDDEIVLTSGSRPTVGATRG